MLAARGNLPEKGYDFYLSLVKCERFSQEIPTAPLGPRNDILNQLVINCSLNSNLQLMPQGSVGGVVKKDRHQTHRHPEHGIMQTNLSMIIAGHPAVIPNLMVSIDDLTGKQLQSGDQSGTEDQLHGQRNPTQH